MKANKKDLVKFEENTFSNTDGFTLDYVENEWRLYDRESDTYMTPNEKLGYCLPTEQYPEMNWDFVHLFTGVKYRVTVFFNKKFTPNNLEPRAHYSDVLTMEITKFARV